MIANVVQGDIYRWDVLVRTYTIHTSFKRLQKHHSLSNNVQALFDEIAKSGRVDRTLV